MNKLITLTMVLLFFTACSNQPAKVKQYYRLSADYDISQNTQKNKRQSVVISRPKAMGILGGRPMVATKKDGALVQLNNHYWLESPSILLHHSLTKWAEQHWQHIQTNAGFNEKHQRLDSEILAFEKDGNQVKVSLKFILNDVDGRLLFNQTYRQNLTIQGEGYAQFVQTVNLAVKRILDALSQTLDKLS